MNSVTRSGFVLTVILSVGPATLFAGQDPLANAKSLYAAASYEEALAVLANVQEQTDADQVDLYRALCLTALNRTKDAERVLEGIVTRTPRYIPDENSVSPKVVSLFSDVRRRVLPVAVRGLYTKAKADFDAKNFATAADSFRNILALLTEEGEDSSPVLEDVEQLAKGFLELSEARMRASAAVSEPAALPKVASADVAAGPLVPPIFGSANADVQPPIALNQEFPAWRASPHVAPTTFRGRLEIVVDENGAVETASILDKIHPLYDNSLLSSAKAWRYKPAMKEGRPVKYRKVIAIDLKP